MNCPVYILAIYIEAWRLDGLFLNVLSIDWRVVHYSNFALIYFYWGIQ